MSKRVPEPDEEDFEPRPEDTVPLWMIDDVELGAQNMRDADERWQELFEPHHGPTLAEWKREQDGDLDGAA